MSYDQEGIQYIVVMNGEEQYSIWPSYKTIPSGWNDVGYRGPKNLCLDYIKEIWQDMRPLSLRKKMEERQKKWEENKKSLLQVPTIDSSQNSQTVSFLTQGEHPVSCRSIYQTCQALRKALSDSYFHLLFTDTKGETCLSLAVDASKTKLQQADFETGTGYIEVSGTLVLDFVKLRCSAILFLETLTGTGSLKVIH